MSLSVSKGISYKTLSAGSEVTYSQVLMAPSRLFTIEVKDASGKDDTGIYNSCKLNIKLSVPKSTEYKSLLDTSSLSISEFIWSSGGDLNSNVTSSWAPPGEYKVKFTAVENSAFSLEFSNSEPVTLASAIADDDLEYKSLELTYAMPYGINGKGYSGVTINKSTSQHYKLSSTESEDIKLVLSDLSAYSDKVSTLDVYVNSLSKSYSGRFAKGETLVLGPLESQDSYSIEVQNSDLFNSGKYMIYWTTDKV